MTISPVELKTSERFKTWQSKGASVGGLHDLIPRREHRDLLGYHPRRSKRYEQPNTARHRKPDKQSFG